jgi:hypothetical protein
VVRRDRTPAARVYLVPAEHFLQLQLAPARYPSLDLAVHRNFYVVNTLWPSGATPCSLDWVDDAVVLRIIKSCKPVVDTS